MNKTRHRILFQQMLCGLALIASIIGYESTPSGQVSSERDISLFGPTVFSRTRQAPQRQTASFSMDPTVVHGPFRIKVTNGDPIGANRLSSARILLNGIQVFGPSDFNQQVGTL